MAKAIKAALEDATSAARAGVVRDALIHSYPRLAGLLENLFEKLKQDTEVSCSMSLGDEALAGKGATSARNARKDLQGCKVPRFGGVPADVPADIDWRQLVSTDIHQAASGNTGF